MSASYFLTMPRIIDKSVFEYGGKTLVALTPDFKTLCVANKNGLSKLLPVDKPEEEPEILEISKSLTSVECDSQSGFLLTTVQGDAYWLNTKTATDQLLARSALPLRDCCVIHSGKMGVFGGDDLELFLIELNDEAHRKHSIKVDEQISQFSYTAQTNLLSISFINGVVQFFSVSSTRPYKVHELTGYIPANTYKEFDSEASLSESARTGARDGDTFDEEQEQRITDPEFCDENRICTRAAWHPKGLQFALPCADFTIKVFNIKGYSLMKTLKNPAFSAVNFIDLKFDPLQGNFLASIDLENILVVWNWQTTEIMYKSEFKHKLTNLIWKVQKDSKTLDIILGTWTGEIVTIQGVAESLPSPNSGSDSIIKDPNAKQNSLFVDSDLDESDVDDASRSKDVLPEENDSENIFTQEANGGKRRYHFDDEEDFIDDDDGAGYVSQKKARQQSPNLPLPGRMPGASLVPSSFRYKPISPGATPYGNGDRRYLTMNDVGYVSVVKNNEQNSITVSFFDIGRFREYHFEDLFGYDVCSLNEKGTLFGQSKSGLLHYRSHNMMHSNWTKTIPLQKGERISSIAATPHRVFVGTSFGYMRVFNQYGVPLTVEKVSPVVALTAQECKVFVVHYSPYHGLSYSMFEQSPTESRYYQRESPLPMVLPQSDPNVGFDVAREFVKFNPIGLKSVFFSTYGDPCIFGSDNVLMVLSKWRSPLESRWLPVLDADLEIWKMTGGKENSQVHVWPLGLNYDTLNCIFVKGKNMWPEFPLPLPSEMEMRIPILVKSKVLEDRKRKADSNSSNEEEVNDQDSADEKENSELVIPPNMAAEEEFLRSKVLSALLKDTLDNDGELYGNENEILASLNGAYDKSLLRLFAAACADQNIEMAASLVKELKQDRALIAAVKISERAELMELTKRVNEIREARFQQQVDNY